MEGLDCKRKGGKNGEHAERTGNGMGGGKVVSGCAAGARGSMELEEIMQTLRSQRPQELTDSPTVSSSSQQKL